MSLIQMNRDAIERLQAAALKRYEDNRKTRIDNLAKLRDQTPLEVDDTRRVSLRRKSIDPRDSHTLERLIGKSDLFPISYLEAGLRAARAVCRIQVRDSAGRIQWHGTGFLVSPSLMMTNNHVLEDKDQARTSFAQFNYEIDLNLQPLPVRNFRLNPDRFFITDQDLDFTLVAVDSLSTDGTPLSDFGYLQFNPRAGKILVGEYASCIQHPEGDYKAVVVRENEFIGIVNDHFVHYLTDTEPGSSGSPVFSDDWKVVALHHSGVPDKDHPGKFVANEGIRLVSIARRISDRKKDLDEPAQLLIDEIYAGLPKEPASGTEETGSRMEVSTPDPEWYKKTAGYDAAFLGAGYTVPLPEIGGGLKDDILTLEDGGHVLDYTHFSLVMSRSRKLALFTAVNIDGSSARKISRSKDVWYLDPRIGRDDQYGPEVYTGNDLDRGHLVRREDPNWGPDAEKANEDTFHFTNCSPQHKNLNQKTWLNLEDYILRNAREHGLKVSVFTGPVCRSDDIVYRGRYRIPAEFWKVVVIVKDDGKLSATAYLQTQKNLIGDLEFAYGAYKTYQVPVATIEDLTGLRFGDLRTCDPFGAIERSAAGRLVEWAGDVRV